MKKNRLFKIMVAASVVVASFTLTSCEDSEKEGEKAGEEFCDCIKNKNNSEKTCLDRLNSNYKKFVNDDEFYNGANRNSCNYRFWKENKYW